MAHGVVIGGFASNQRHVDRVSAALSRHYDYDIEGVSFRNAMDDRDQVERLAKQATVFTHSAGMLAVKDTMPNEIIAIAPPLPTVSPRLVARAALSGCGLALSSFASIERLAKVNECGCDAASELLRHLDGNLRQLGSIASFNALETGAAAASAGIETSIAFMRKDRFFRPTEAALAEANAQGVTAVMLPGHHDELLCFPEKTIGEFEAAKEELKVISVELLA